MLRYKTEHPVFKALHAETLAAVCNFIQIEIVGDLCDHFPVLIFNQRHPVRGSLPPAPAFPAVIYGVYVNLTS